MQKVLAGETRNDCRRQPDDKYGGAIDRILKIGSDATWRMISWFTIEFFAVALVFGGALYIRLRWHRSPQAYRAMIGLPACYFRLGLDCWRLGAALRIPTSPQVVTPTPSIAAPAPVASAANPPNTFSAKVTNITDSDTVHVVDAGGASYAIRLAGIDAPEHDQAFGTQSTQHLSSMTSGKTVTLECENERFYGRLICKILLPNGEDVDLDQVKAGMAWHYKTRTECRNPLS